MPAEQEAIPVNIGNINDGAMIEAFAIEFGKALKNIADPNTQATATRTVTLTLLLKPHADRIQIDTEFKATSKLTPIETHHSKCFLGVNDEGGFVAYVSDPRQMPLWHVQKPDKEKLIQFGNDGVQK
jgi:hypothetical protein